MSTISIKLDVTYELSATVGDLRAFVELCDAHNVPDDAVVKADGDFVRELAVDVPTPADTAAPTVPLAALATSAPAPVADVTPAPEPAAAVTPDAAAAPTSLAEAGLV